MRTSHARSGWGALITGRRQRRNRRAITPLGALGGSSAIDGATGWVAGLVNAFPKESIVLFKLARAGRWAEAEPLYHWFLPLLRMDVVPKFVQLIKLVQSHVG